MVSSPLSTQLTMTYAPLKQPTYLQYPLGPIPSRLPNPVPPQLPQASHPTTIKMRPAAPQLIDPNMIVDVIKKHFGV